MATATPFSLANRVLRFHVGSGDDMDVRHFKVTERLFESFDIEIVALCRNPDVDLGAIAGSPARFEVAHSRFWSGICAEAEQIEAEEDGASTYRFRLVPQLWLLGHRKNYRVFQQVSELDIVLDVLGRWGITPRCDLAAGDYKPRRYRVQYGETDLAFVRRMLEDAGIAYYFEQADDRTELVLSDRPNKGVPAGDPIPYVAKPNDRINYEHATKLRIAQRVRPGKFVQADVDWRRPPEAPIEAAASGGKGIESSLELYTLEYGSFLFKANDGDGSTPVADDRGAQRTDDAEGAKVAQRRLDAARNDALVVTFQTTAHAVRPGQVIAFRGHPRADLAQNLLVESAVFEGEHEKAWSHVVEARAASADYRPPLGSPRPKPSGVESATVVGPPGEEIHTDEFGRIRVQFHWDREGGRDDKSSCWVPVSQNWGGSSFGAVSLPRVGQEVLVDFLGGDPDRPVIMGRVFTKTQPVPYELPKFKSMTGFRSETYPRPKAGAGGGSPRGFGMPMGEGAESVPSTPPWLPGEWGGAPADASKFADLLKRSKSKGPDETAHARSCNEIMMCDDNGKEQLHIQAQKNFAINVKNNWSGSVGRNRVMNIHGNDSETVDGFQGTTVDKDRSVTVNGKQTTTVKGLIKQETTEASQYIFAKEDIVHACKVNRTVGTEMNLIRCGSSTIVMRPGFVIIQADELFLNPGQAATDAAIESGTKPQTAAEKEAQEKAAAEAARKAEQQRAEAEMRMRNAAGNYARQNRGKAFSGEITKQQYMQGYEQSMRDAGAQAGYPQSTIDDIAKQEMSYFR